MLNRDSLIWTAGAIGSVIVGLASLNGDLSAYGIPASALPYIRGAALIVGIVSGKLATSPLPGKPSGSAPFGKVEPRP